MKCPIALLWLLFIRILCVLCDKVEVIGQLQCCESLITKEVPIEQQEKVEYREKKSFSGAEVAKIDTIGHRHKLKNHDKKPKVEEIAIGCYRPRNVTIQLWEEDGFWPFDNHDLLAQEMTDEHGHFHLKGFEEEFLFEDFFLLAYSTCGLSSIQIENGCKRVSKFKINRDWGHILLYYERHEVTWKLIEVYLKQDHIGGENCA